MNMQILLVYTLISMNKPALQNSQLGKDWAMALSSEIVKSSIKYDIEPELITGIMMQESGYKLQVIAGNDYGLMQVNQYNIDAKGLDKDRLLKDMPYSIDQGVSILKWFKDTYADKEPELWWSRYNCGTRKMDNVCKRYANRVKKYLHKKEEIIENKP